MDPSPGVPGVSKDAPGSTKHAIWGLVRKYCPQIEEYLKYYKKTGFFWHFFSILMIFRSLCLLGAILAQKLDTFFCSIFLWIFWHPWDPWERVHIDLNKNSVQTGCVLSGLIGSISHDDLNSLNDLDSHFDLRKGKNASALDTEWFSWPQPFWKPLFLGLIIKNPVFLWYLAPSLLEAVEASLWHLYEI